MIFPINSELKELFGKAVVIILNLSLLVFTVCYVFSLGFRIDKDVSNDIFTISALLIPSLGILSQFLKGVRGVAGLLKTIIFLIYGIISLTLPVLLVIRGIPRDEGVFEFILFFLLVSIATIIGIILEFKNSHLFSKAQISPDPQSASLTIESSEIQTAPVPPDPTVKAEVYEPQKTRKSPFLYFERIFKTRLGIVYLCVMPVAMLGMGLFMGYEHEHHLDDIQRIPTPTGLFLGNIIAIIYYIFFAAVIRSIRNQPMGNFWAGLLLLFQVVILKEILSSLAGIKDQPGQYPFGVALFAVWLAFHILTKPDEFFENIVSIKKDSPDSAS
jgi:hypothetical protein